MAIEVTAPVGRLQETIDSLPDNAEPAVVHLGTAFHHEKVTVRRANTTLLGTGATVISWQDGARDLMPDGYKRGTFRSYTLAILAPGCSVRHVMVDNSAAPRDEVGQAVALFVDGDGFVCEHAVLRSYQDTLFAAPLPEKEVEPRGFVGPTEHSPRTRQKQVYRHCRIEGDVDFIFGGAAAWFDRCEIVAIDGRRNRGSDGPIGYCTAPSTPAGQPMGFVFDRCLFTGDKVPDRSFYLGRPWRETGQCVLLDCQISPHIRPEGWHDWGKPGFASAGFFAETAQPGQELRQHVHILTPEESSRYTFRAFTEMKL